MGTEGGRPGGGRKRLLLTDLNRRRIRSRESTLDKRKELEKSSKKAYSQERLVLEKLADAVHDPGILVKALCRKDHAVRFNAVRVLAAFAEKGIDISPAIPQLVAGLSDRDPLMRSYSAWALGNAAKNGADISRAVKMLALALSTDRQGTCRAAMAFALCAAGENGADLRAVRSALMAASVCDDSTVRRFAGDALFSIGPEEKGQR